MDKADLMNLSEKYRKKAEDAFANYQGTGIARYEREYRNADDMAEAFAMAANASEDHTSYMHLKAEFLWLAGKAESAVTRNAPKDELEEILKEVVSAAVTYCHYERKEVVRRGGDRR